MAFRRRTSQASIPQFSTSPGSDYWIDILSRLGEVFRYADVESEIFQIEGLPIRVATPRMLYRMKRDTVRPQDRVDAQLLKHRFDLGDN